jgi:hypothetical protein
MSFSFPFLSPESSQVDAAAEEDLPEAPPPEVQPNQPLPSALNTVLEHLEFLGRRKDTRRTLPRLPSIREQPPAIPNDLDPETASELNALYENFKGYLTTLRQEVQDEFFGGASYREVRDEIEYGIQWIQRGLQAFEADREAADARLRRATVHRPADGELDEKIAAAQAACADVDGAIDGVRGGRTRVTQLKDSATRAREAFRALDGVLEGMGV